MTSDWQAFIVRFVHTSNVSVKFAVLLVAILVHVIAGSLVYASDREKPDDRQTLRTELAVHPLKPPDTSSPRATLVSFLDNAYEAYRLVMKAHDENNRASGLITKDNVRQMGAEADRFLRRAARCLDLSQVPEALRSHWGREGVLFLKEIFDRIELPSFHEIPDSEAVDIAEEGMRETGVYRWRVPDTEIVISRIEEGPRQGEFLFAADIIPHLDEFVEKVKHLPYKSGATVTPGFLEFYDTSPGVLLPPKWGQWIPSWSNAIFYYQTIWQWCLMTLLLLFVTVVVWMLYRITTRRISRQRAATWAWGRVAISLLTALLINRVLYALTLWIGISGPVLTVLNLTIPAIVWLFVAMAAYQACMAMSATIIASPRIDPHGINAGLILTCSRFAGFTVALMIIFHGLSSVGVSLVPIIASLGVGGLAVALAARPTLENLIGGMMILIDKPYQVGERVMVKGYDGNIEKVGWRSTRIRLRTGPLVTIPNEEMARLDIENIDRRPFIRRLANITITYDTPPDKVEKAIQIIKEILDNHEGMDPGAPPWVFFDEFNADSLNIVVYYWFHPPHLEKFYQFSEKVNLKIMRAFEKEGIAFAFPTTTTYLTQDDGHPLQVQLGTQPTANPKKQE
jgi:MscS family membrane protein